MNTQYPARRRYLSPQTKSFRIETEDLILTLSLTGSTGDYSYTEHEDNGSNLNDYGDGGMLE